MTLYPEEVVRFMDDTKIELFLLQLAVEKRIKFLTKRIKVSNCLAEKRQRLVECKRYKDASADLETLAQVLADLDQSS